MKRLPDHFVWSTLQHLELVDCDLSSVGIGHLANTSLPHLKKLRVAYGKFRDGWRGFAQLLMTWPNIKTLSLKLACHNGGLLEGLLSCNLPRLHTFKILISQLRPEHLNFIFLASWPRLKPFTVVHCLPMASQSLQERCSSKWPGLSLDVHRVAQVSDNTHTTDDTHSRYGCC